jgi:bacillithiol system protein YtxJ
VSAAEIAARPERSIIYKHSKTCSLCSWSNDKLGELADQDGITLELVDVIAPRALSQQIEAQFGVRHESPQILIIEDGRVLWHATGAPTAAPPGEVDALLRALDPRDR